MATANIDLSDGTKVKIEGSPDEIARVLELYGHARTLKAATVAAVAVPAPTQRVRRSRPDTSTAARARTGAMQHIRELIPDEYFAERRSLAAVQAKLEERGRIYPQSHLSTPLRRLVMNKELRRLREGKNWVYVAA
jgi:hypothetical protein